MPYSEDFELPVIETQKVYPEKAASEQAFYAAASYSDNPIEDYHKIHAELSQKGSSELFDIARRTWTEEQDTSNRVAIVSLIEDPSIDEATKKNLISNYALGGGISTSLKDKFSEKIAAVDTSITTRQKQAQDAVIKALPKNEQKVKEKVSEDFVAESWKGVKDLSVASGVVAWDFAKAIPLSLAGLYTAVTEADAVEGQKVAVDIINKYKTGTLPQDQESIRNYIEDKISYLGKPGEWVREKLYNSTGNINTAISLSYFLDPVNYVPVGLVFKGVRAGVTAPVKGAAKLAKKIVGIKPDTPATTASISNPRQAAQLLSGAMEDATDMTAKSLGTSKGDIIADSILPKLDVLEDPSVHPDLRNKLKNEFKEQDVEFNESLNNIKYDPNIQDLVTMTRDREIVFDVIKETRGLSYMQNKSFLQNTVGNLFEGKAVFGRDGEYFFGSRTAAINAYKVLEESIKDFPPALKGSIAIVDKLTDKRYTPEELLKETSLMSKTELNQANAKLNPETDIPGYKENEILAKTYDEKVLEVSKDLYDVSKELSKEEVSMLQRKMQTLQKQATDLRQKNQQALEAYAKDIFSGSDFVGETPPKQLAVEWNWSKEYDQINHHIFGDDAVNANLGIGKFSVNVSKLARSSIADWVFGPGTLPYWYEKAAARVAPRAASAANIFIAKLKKDVASTPYRKQLAELISEGMETGKEVFTPRELASKFLELREKDIDRLFETHVKVRRLIHYTHAYINYQKRFELQQNSFTKGLYVDGTYKGAINDSISFEGKLAPRYVWDFDLDSNVALSLDTKKVADPVTGKKAAYDVGGKKVVSLAKPIDIDGNKYEYALVGTDKVKVDLLPDIVVPRIPGYFPRSYKEHFFIDRTPTLLNVNGFSVVDKQRLSNYTEAIAAASTKYEAKALLDELQNKYKGQDVTITLRAAREDNFGTVLNDYEVHGQILRHAQQRGEHLPTINGRRAKVEDPLGTLVATISQLTRTGSMLHFDDAVQKAFVREYQEFLPDAKFPDHISGIKASVNMDEVAAKKFNEARTVFAKYSKLKTFDSTEAEMIRKTLYSVADVIEEFKIPANLIRDAANKAESIVNAPRKLAATLYISLFPQKQYIVQMQTFLELAAMFPLSAPKLMADTLALRGALLAEATAIGGKESTSFLQSLFRKASVGMDRVEFDKTLKAIKSSGLLESIDLNMMVHGLFNELDRPLVESKLEAAGRYATAVPKTITKVSKSVGFDNAETINRIGLWLAAKDMWKKRNPGKDWTTKQAIEEISYDEWSLSGSMSRAGSMAYQQGILSNFFQFAAITHKLTMNLFQDNATRLTDAQRFRLGLARFALWGSKNGLPLGEIISNYVASIEDERLKETLMSMEKGLIDRGVNSMLELITGESSELNLSKAMSPYTKYVHPAFGVLAEMSKAWDGKSGDPRFPVFSAWGSLGDTFSTMSKWFESGEVNKDNWTKVVWESANVAAGMSNLTKSLYMLEHKDKLSKMGQPMNLEATSAEAIGQAFGITTYREEALWNGLNALADRKAMIKSVSEDLYKHLVILRRDFPGTWQTEATRLSSFMSMLEGDNFTETDKQEVMTRIIELDKQNSKGSIGSSFIMELLKLNTDKNSAEVNKGLTYLKQFDKDPKVQELLELTKGTK
jgi:hypothetical protein